MNPRQSMVDRINAANRALLEEAKVAFLGTSARFLDGRYRGRWGAVRAVLLDDREGIMLLVQPYRSRVVGPTGLPLRIVDHDADFLHSHAEARRYRPVRSYAFTDDYEPCRACKRRVAKPCHDRDGFQEGGPWDSSCRHHLYEERT